MGLWGSARLRPKPPPRPLARRMGGVGRPVTPRPDGADRVRAGGACGDAKCAQPTSANLPGPPGGGGGGRFGISLRTAGGHRWQDSIHRRRLALNRRRLALNRRRLTDDQRQRVHRVLDCAPLPVSPARSRARHEVRLRARARVEPHCPSIAPGLRWPCSPQSIAGEDRSATAPPGTARQGLGRTGGGHTPGIA